MDNCERCLSPNEQRCTKRRDNKGAHSNEWTLLPACRSDAGALQPQLAGTRGVLGDGARVVAGADDLVGAVVFVDGLT